MTFVEGDLVLVPFDARSHEPGSDQVEWVEGTVLRSFGRSLIVGTVWGWAYCEAARVRPWLVPVRDAA